MGDKDCAVRSAAPAEIWAFYNAELAEDHCGATMIAHEDRQPYSHRFVRADLYDALKQELDGIIAMIGEST